MVRVDLAITTAQNTIGAGIDTVLNMNGLSGSAYGDELYGTDGRNQIFGGSYCLDWRTSNR